MALQLQVGDTVEALDDLKAISGVELTKGKLYVVLAITRIDQCCVVQCDTGEDHAFAQSRFRLAGPLKWGDLVVYRGDPKDNHDIGFTVGKTYTVRGDPNDLHVMDDDGDDRYADMDRFRLITRGGVNVDGSAVERDFEPGDTIEALENSFRIERGERFVVTKVEANHVGFYDRDDDPRERCKSEFRLVGRLERFEPEESKPEESKPEVLCENWGAWS